jgi:hypothetical protein
LLLGLLQLCALAFDLDHDESIALDVIVAEQLAQTMLFVSIPGIGCACAFLATILEIHITFPNA